MSTAIQTTTAIEAALVQGDLSKLSPVERLSYYKSVCSSLGLNPLTKPFDYIQLSGKLTLYAKRDCTDQLRQIHGVSIAITARENINDVYVVSAKARDKTGREDESTGAVAIAGLKGENLANAYMKAETKAKRRVTLSVCGLGFMDESETGSISGAVTVSADQAHSEAIEHKPAEDKKPAALAAVVNEPEELPAFPPPAKPVQEMKANIVSDVCPQCSGRMMISKFAPKDNPNGTHPYYCSKCRVTVSREM